MVSTPGPAAVASSGTAKGADQVQARGGTMACRPRAMVGLIRLICEPQDHQPDGPQRKVFDVPKSEAANLKRRLERNGWTVTAIEL